MVGKNFLENKASKTFDILAPTHSELNLLNYADVENYLRKAAPDIIIHAAGKVGGIQANINNPVLFLVENLDIGRNVVLAARKTGIKKLINLGSSCMYPRNAMNPLKEECVLAGELEPTNEGYALAKIVTARLCSYIFHEDNTYQYKTLIPCNLYGRWDKFDIYNAHLIPAIIDKLHKAKQAGHNEVVIWGDGKARREFMDAEDLAGCLAVAVEKFDSLPSIMNVGLGYDYTIDEYYQMAAQIIGYRGKFVHDTGKPAGMKQKLVDIHKQNQWGWRAQMDIQTGIAKTYSFYLERFNYDYA